MWHRDRKWANAVGKIVPTGPLDAGGFNFAETQTFNLGEKKKVHHLQSTTNQSTIKQAPPVLQTFH